MISNITHTTNTIPPHAAPANRGPSTPASSTPRVQDTVDISTNPVAVDSSDKEPGALRLLKAGHFKGVAELRQRIHFADQIAQEDAQAGASQLTGSLSDLTAVVDEQLTELGETVPLNEEQAAVVDTLKEQFNETVSQLTGDTSLSIDDIGALLRSAADTLLQGLTDLNAAAPAEEPADPDVSVTDSQTPQESTDPTATDPTATDPATTELTLDLTDFINSLGELLNTEIDSLVSSANSVSVLPELSEPIGRGAAYDKHLATYLALQSSNESTATAPDDTQTTTAAPTAPDPALDVIA